jgi:tetratricopeptide (TPR) repeat protein
MKRAQRLTVLLLSAAATWMMPPVSALRADEFTDERLRDGQESYAARRYAEAVDEFRVAAFESLDKPTVLTECIVRLSLAQAGAGKTSDVSLTLERFLDVERRFSAYSKANLQPEIRAAFKTLLFSSVPQATVLAVPSLSGMIETEEQKLAKLPPADRRKALEAAARRDPGSVTWPIGLSRDSLEHGDPKEAERWATRALSIQPQNSDALALRARARAAKGDCSGALSDLAALSPQEHDNRPELYADDFVCLVDVRNWDAAALVAGRVPPSSANRPDVAAARTKLAAEQQRRTGTTTAASAAAPKVAAPAPAPAAPDPARSRVALEESHRLVLAGKPGDAEKTLNEALKTDPGNRELRLALLEATCLNRSYQTGAAQVALVKPFAEAEAPSMFYAAVVLYETGKVDEARTYMKQAMPRVSGPLVDEYANKILPTGSR